MHKAKDWLLRDVRLHAQLGRDGIGSQPNLCIMSNLRTQHAETTRVRAASGLGLFTTCTVIQVELLMVVTLVLTNGFFLARA